jgi:O-antigen/teichoic acid export membrane protein
LIKIRNIHEVNPAKEFTIREKFKFLGKDTLLYGGASAVSKSLTLLTFPLFAKHFAVNDFGEIDVLSTFITLLVTVVIMGQDSALVRFYYEDDNIERRKQLISQSLIFQLLFAVIILPLIWFFSGKISFITTGSRNLTLFIKIIVFQIPFQVILLNTQALMQFTFQRFKFIILTLGLAFVNVLALGICILMYKGGMIYIFYINLFSAIGFAILSLFFLRDWLVIPKNFFNVKVILPYAIPMGLIVTINSFQPYIERLIVTNLIGLPSLGVYAAGAKISLIIALPIGAFQAAWGPFMMSMFKRNDAIITFNWILKFLTLGLCVSGLFIGSLAHSILQTLAGEKYLAADVLVFPIVMGLIIQCVALFTGMGNIISSKTYFRLISYLAAIIVSVIAIIFLVKAFGLVGVGLGVLTGQIAKSFFESYFGQRLWPLEWAYKGVIILIITTIVLGLGVSVVFKNEIIITALLLISIPAIIAIAWGVLFSSTERVKILIFIAAIKNKYI